MNLNLFKYFFIALIVGLIIAGIYIIYIKDDGSGKSSAVESKEINMTREISIGIIDFDTVNPILTKNLEISQLTKLVYEPLVNVSQDFRIEPGLASECSKLDELTYIMKLDENKKWADGDKITFDDIEFTINTIKTVDTIYNENVQPIERIEKIDENTLKIYLVEATDFFEYYLCFPIMQKKTYNEEIPIGSGGVTISEVNEKKIIFEGDKIRLIAKIYKSATELYNNFTRGNIDLMITQNTDYEKYIGNMGYEKNLIPGRDFYYISCDNIKDIEFRKYINENINKEKINFELNNNQYIIANFPLDYGSFLNSEKKEKSTSTKSYKKRRISLSTEVETKEIAKLIKEQLKEKGITVNIQNYVNKNADLIIKKEKILITPDIRQYLKNTEELNKIVKIENKDVLKEEYKKVIGEYYNNMPFISLYFNSYIILHNNKLKGDFTGNWYNIFYNIDTWYKVI